MILYFVTANALLKHFDYANIQHVPRVKNQEANDLAQIASGYQVSKVKFEELIEIKEKLVSTDISLDELSTTKLGGAKESNKFEEGERYAEIFAIDNLSDNDWRKPIVEYLQTPTGTTSRKTKYRALSYVIVRNELFKKTP